MKKGIGMKSFCWATLFSFLLICASGLLIGVAVAQNPVEVDDGLKQPEDFSIFHFDKDGKLEPTTVELGSYRAFKPDGCAKGKNESDSLMPREMFLQFCIPRDEVDKCLANQADDKSLLAPDFIGMLLCFPGRLDPLYMDGPKVGWTHSSLHLSNLPGEKTDYCNKLAGRNGLESDVSPLHGLHVKIVSNRDEHVAIVQIQTSFSDKKYQFELDLAKDECFSMVFGPAYTQFLVNGERLNLDMFLRNGEDDFRMLFSSLANGELANTDGKYTGIWLLAMDMARPSGSSAKDGKNPLQLIGYRQQCPISTKMKLNYDKFMGKHFPGCKSFWVPVKPARIDEKVENEQLETSYHIHVGFIQAKDDMLTRDKYKIKNYTKFVTEKIYWKLAQNQQILDFLKGINQSLSFEPSEWFYAEIPAEWADKGVEMLIHECDGAIFGNIPRPSESVNDHFAFDWGKDFDFVDACVSQYYWNKGYSKGENSKIEYDLDGGFDGDREFTLTEKKALLYKFGMKGLQDVPKRSNNYYFKDDPCEGHYWKIDKSLGIFFKYTKSKKRALGFVQYGDVEIRQRVIECRIGKFWSPRRCGLLNGKPEQIYNWYIWVAPGYWDLEVRPIY